MYESRTQKPLPRRHFVRRMILHFLGSMTLIASSLFIGMLGYHHYEGLEWSDAFLNASMLLGGMGPVDTPHTEAGKLFAGFYALYAGLVFLVAIGLIAAPAFHRMMHRFHWEEGKNSLLILLSLGVLGTAAGECRAQVTPQPTPPPGKNRVVFDSRSSAYSFLLESDTLYRYSVGSTGDYLHTGGTFTAIQARSQGSDYFLPSFAGGIYLKRGTREIFPWTPGVTYKRLALSTAQDTVTARWRMKIAGGADSADYSFRIHISGRTLVIRVQVEGPSRNAHILNLSRSERTPGASIARIPSLTMFNILRYNGTFTSMFFDWEVTNATRLWGHQPRSCCDSDRPTSMWFSQCAYYDPLTNGTRRRLKETIYLTVSTELSEVLPNLPGPRAPLKTEATRRTILWYHPPYPWAITPTGLDNFNYLGALKFDRGVDSVAMIMGTWSRHGYVSKLPDVLPANTYTYPSNACPADRTDGNVLLRNVRDYIVNTLHYSFALYENYVDVFPEAKSHRNADRALGSNGKPLRGFANCGKQSNVLKPGRAAAYDSAASLRLKKGTATERAVEPTWCYLDVTSAVNPSERVDCDATTDSAGMFLYTLHKYRALPAIARKIYGGPVLGEGGNHMLHAGYYDGFEGRIQTCDYTVYGYKAPLLVDFDLLKIHPRSALHGVGLYSFFFANPTADVLHGDAMERGEMLEFIATELAFGHGGLVTKYPFNRAAKPPDHTLDHAVLEDRHVLPVYGRIADAVPVSILYQLPYVNAPPALTASEYVQRYGDYWDIRSRNFMSRVMVTYDNGAVIAVNRSGEEWKVGRVGVPGGWFTCNAVAQGLNAGAVANNDFRLPPRNGWVAYLPR